ncbi:uncharacterized protein LOC144449897 [Glandiceps talaboti]
MATLTDPFNDYLIELSEDITEDKLHKLLNYASGLTPHRITATEEEAILSKRDPQYAFLKKLTELGHISRTNSAVLIQLLKKAGLVALAEKVKERFQQGFEF